MVKLFNDNWLFAEMPIGKIPEESDYKPVDIPHDWQIWHVKDLYRTSDGWYKKTFRVEKTAGRVFSLRFEGVYMDTEVYLNGEKIFEWKYGYTTFDVPISPVEGDNEIKLRVRYQYPNTRWYSGAGIYRNVWLRETGVNRIKDDGTYFASYPEGDIWSVEIDTELSSEADCVIKHTLFNMDGDEVLSVKTAVPVGNDRISQTFEIMKPELWSVDRPYLYSLLTEMLVDDERVDERYERVGFKYVRFDKDKGLFLNGKNIKINGACMHHDLGALGSAFNKAAARRQLEALKEMGVNAIRTSHNPPAPEFMDLCDEMGFLVDSEILDMWQDRKTTYDYARFFDEWHERDVRSWIRRDRNHVSIIMWSIGNEIGDTNDIPRGVELTKELKRCVRIDDYKNTRPVTIGSNHMRWQGAQNCAEELGAIGYNYLESIYDEHHKAHPEWIIYGSETASTIQSRGVYHFPAAVYTTTHDDLQCSSLLNCATGWGAPNVEYNITEDRNRKFSLGQFIWTGWDYIGEPTPYRTKNSYFGHIDTAGFPKDSFYAYRAEWNESAPPFIHLFPYWDWNDGQLIDIFAFTNCAEAEVFVNGKSLGRKKYSHDGGNTLTGRWQTTYEKGEITAVGYDASGKEACRDTQSSFLDPAEIVLESDRKNIYANGEDMCFIAVSVKDKDGNTVENARSRINVSVLGPARIMGLDNGDSTDNEEYKTCSKRLFNGRLIIMLASTFEAGEISVCVSSPGLPDKTVLLNSSPARAREGVSCGQCAIDNTFKNDIPVRKIELSLDSRIITPKTGKVLAKVKVYPENSGVGPQDISFKAVTQTGVETNISDIIHSDDGAEIIPRGDGTYRIRAYYKNDSECEQIISELEAENSGFGPASFDPYNGIVLASLCTNADSLQSDMGGGVLLRNCKNVLFKKTDFGKIGSDEITIGIYTYNEDIIPVELTADGNHIMTLNFQAKTEWNTYKFNTFTLPEKLIGVHDIELKFNEELRFLGFEFSNPRRIGTVISALENDALYGDSFEIGAEMIEKIGNNVSILFKNVDFNDGASLMEITGLTRNPRETIRLSLSNQEDINVIFEGSDEIVTQRFEIPEVKGIQDLTAVFLPGTDFDFKSIKFLKG